MPAHTVRNWRPWRKNCSHPMLVINYVTKLACLTLKVEYFHHFKVPANTSQRSGSVTVCPLKACKGRGQSGWWIKKGGLQLHNRSARPSQQLRVAQSVCDWTPKPPPFLLLRLSHYPDLTASIAVLSAGWGRWGWGAIGLIWPLCLS